MAFSGEGAAAGASAGAAFGPWGAAIGGIIGGFSGGGKVPSTAISGVGVFDVQNRNSPTIKRKVFDFDDPVHYLVIGGLVVAGIWTWKNVGKK